MHFKNLPWTIKIYRLRVSCDTPLEPSKGGRVGLGRDNPMLKVTF